MANERKPRRWFWFLAALLALAIPFACLWLALGSYLYPSDQLAESFDRGDRTAKDKIAIVKVEGVLMEGMIDFARRQIDQAMRDEAVKAVVLRIDSPGGTISASEILYRQLIELRDGSSPRFENLRPKKLVVSMGALAASGGYYISMPAEKLFAENYCLTGSIGVYASLPNVSELAHRNGVTMELIKAGDIKASGSPFHKMTPAERQPWQEMVDDAYDRFLTVVTTGRPKLPRKEQWKETLFEKEVLPFDDKGVPVPDGKPVKMKRYRADGGTYTAKQAVEYGLIDEIGTLQTAVEAAAKSAGLAKYKVVRYVRPTSFLEDVVGVRVKEPSLDWQQFANGLVPRGWFLMPGADLAGLLAASHSIW